MASGQTFSGGRLSACSTSVRRSGTSALCAVLVRRVRLDDVLHETVAYDVDFGQVDEIDPIDALEDALHLQQPRVLAARQVDLRLVTRDHDARIETETRQEHLHLRARRILRFIENDERIRE